MALEELLNSLIQRGWKAFGNEFTRVYVLRDRINKWAFALHFEYEQNGTTRTTFRGRRQLVNKESGLWQFVCENGMIKAIGSEIEIKNLNEGYGVVRDTDYQYRLIVSALKDESELEDFLLQNIKIDE